MTALMLAALLFISQAPQQQVRKASIEGIVTSSSTSEPLMRAQVLITKIQPPGAPNNTPIVITSGTVTPGQIQPITTERDGKFEFKDLDPGQYRLRVVRSGYAPQEYGQRTSTTAGIPITLTEGQQMKNVAFKLTAAGVVAGRVRDSNGEPVGRVQVQLMRTLYSINGQRNYSSVGNATTDDRGDYRIFWVPPGRYIVSVTSNNSNLPIEILFSSNSPYSDRTFPPTYYPGTPDPTRATSIDLKPGAEITGIDFTLSQLKTYRIRGRMVDSTTGQAPRSANINVLLRQDQGPVVSLPGNLGATTTYNNTDGTFEIRNVVQGSYWLRAQATTNTADPIDRNLVAQARTNSELLDLALLGRNGATVQVPIDVGSQDLEGVVLNLAPGVNIPIQLRIEGQQDLASFNGLDRIRVFLRPTTTSASTGNQRVNFTPEGTSTIENVSAGEYRVSVNLPQPEYIIKEARFEGADVFLSPWQISSRTSGTLSVVLSPKGGVIEGSLLDALQKPVTGNQVVLIPDQGRDRGELYKQAQTDASGHFSIKGVYPGSYKLYSWEAIEANSYFDPAVLSQYESLGRAVLMQEGSKENIDLKLIPVKQ
jgi:hypothetical protein